MKANELMTGDWVQVKDCIDQSYYFDEYEPGEIVQVREILDNGINPNWAGAEVSSILGLEDIHPIPITPEILEKNGFKKLGFDGWDFDYETEGGCLIYEVLWRCDYPKEYHTHLTIKSYSPDFGSFKSFRIDSVHELQHALRLCGIDKEIVL